MTLPDRAGSRSTAVMDFTFTRTVRRFRDPASTANRSTSSCCDSVADRVASPVARHARRASSHAAPLAAGGGSGGSGGSGGGLCGTGVACSVAVWAAGSVGWAADEKRGRVGNSEACGAQGSPMGENRLRGVHRVETVREKAGRMLDAQRKPSFKTIGLKQITKNWALLEKQRDNDTMYSDLSCTTI